MDLVNLFMCFSIFLVRLCRPMSVCLYYLFFPLNDCFLDASTHLYKRVCPSVRRSVGPSVRRSDGPSVRRSVGPSRVFLNERITGENGRK